MIAVRETTHVFLYQAHVRSYTAGPLLRTDDLDFIPSRTGPHCIAATATHSSQQRCLGDVYLISSTLSAAVTGEGWKYLFTQVKLHYCVCVCVCVSLE